MYEDELIGAIKIKDGLFIGDESAVTDLEFIITNKVTYVINTAGKQVENMLENLGVQYLTFFWQESDKQILFDLEIKRVNEIVDFIEEANSKGESCLVHSVRGQSRACCALTAYFMRHYQWTLLKTLDYLNSRRSDLEIRATFFDQLKDLEAYLQSTQQGAISSEWKAADTSMNTLSVTKVENTPEEILLRNTYMNSKPGPIPDYYINMTKPGAKYTPNTHSLNMKPTPTKIVWSDQVSNDKKSTLSSSLNQQANPTAKKGISVTHRKPSPAPFKRTHAAQSNFSYSDQPNQQTSIPSTHFESILKGSNKTFKKSTGQEVVSQADPTKTLAFHQLPGNEIKPYSSSSQHANQSEQNLNSTSLVKQSQQATQQSNQNRERNYSDYTNQLIQPFQQSQNQQAKAGFEYGTAPPKSVTPKQQQQLNSNSQQQEEATTTTTGAAQKISNNIHGNIINLTVNNFVNTQIGANNSQANQNFQMTSANNIINSTSTHLSGFNQQNSSDQSQSYMSSSKEMPIQTDSSKQIAPAPLTQAKQADPNRLANYYKVLEEKKKQQLQLQQQQQEQAQQQLTPQQQMYFQNDNLQYQVKQQYQHSQVGRNTFPTPTQSSLSQQNQSNQILQKMLSKGNNYHQPDPSVYSKSLSKSFNTSKSKNEIVNTYNQIPIQKDYNQFTYVRQDDLKNSKNLKPKTSVQSQISAYQSAQYNQLNLNTNIQTFNNQFASQPSTTTPSTSSKTGLMSYKYPIKPNPDLFEKRPHSANNNLSAFERQGNNNSSNNHESYIMNNNFLNVQNRDPSSGLNINDNMHIGGGEQRSSSVQKQRPSSTGGGFRTSSPGPKGRPGSGNNQNGVRSQLILTSTNLPNGQKKMVARHPSPGGMGGPQNNFSSSLLGNNSFLTGSGYNQVSNSAKNKWK